MPQLIPFYFMHLLSFGMLALVILTYFISVYILPNMLRLMLARMMITKL
uniref:ATP synthase protein 8 n=1 Tax=Metschnikowia drosophilae TaxID=135833 RepID=A0A7H1CNG9_9ASCO|nr:Atp8 [Metschnikowia drosophilae]QNS23015.1 Atp8 [Metschnikowia drosophilae]QNS23026.1 Atp8 [Metschnikowia drosophilae]